MEWTIYIDRSVRDVFAVVSDPRYDPRWRWAVRSCQQTAHGGGDANLGARYEILRRPLGLGFGPQVTTKVEVVTYQPPHVIAWRQIDRFAASLVRYEVVPHGSQTRFTQRRQVDWHVSPWLRGWADRALARTVRRETRALKNQLELSLSSEVESMARYLP